MRKVLRTQTRPTFPTEKISINARAPSIRASSALVLKNLSNIIWESATTASSYAAWWGEGLFGNRSKTARKCLWTSAGSKPTKVTSIRIASIIECSDSPLTTSSITNSSQTRSTSSGMSMTTASIIRSMPFSFYQSPLYLIYRRAPSNKNKPFFCSFITKINLPMLRLLNCTSGVGEWTPIISFLTLPK